jgi:NDP-sugar pyrophosphorylase family protein
LFEDWSGQAFSLERDLFPELAKVGHLRAAPLQAEFIDIGVPADYFRFCRWVESGKVGLP